MSSFPVYVSHDQSLNLDIDFGHNLAHDIGRYLARDLGHNLAHHYVLLSVNRVLIIIPIIIMFSL